MGFEKSCQLKNIWYWNNTGDIFADLFYAYLPDLQANFNNGNFLAASLVYI